MAILGSMLRGLMGGNRPDALRALQAKFSPPYRLHLGCGSQRKPGWINIDRDAGSAVDLQWDLSLPLPFDDDTCEFVYHEHLIEHFPPATGVRILAECRRVLRPGGTLRVATPSLEELIASAHDGSWRDAAWLKLPANQYIRTRAEMLNVCFRAWGHQWLYDWEELERRLREAGFETLRRERISASGIAALCNLETRQESTLIAEAVKR